MKIFGEILIGHLRVDWKRVDETNEDNDPENQGQNYCCDFGEEVLAKEVSYSFVQEVC